MRKIQIKLHGLTLFDNLRKSSIWICMYHLVFVDRYSCSPTVVCVPTTNVTTRDDATRSSGSDIS